jgi:hypothetical protein
LERESLQNKVQVRSYWIKINPESNVTGLLTGRGTFGHRDTSTQRRPMKMAAEAGVMQLQGQGMTRIAGNA